MQTGQCGSEAQLRGSAGFRSTSTWASGVCRVRCRHPPAQQPEGVSLSGAAKRKAHLSRPQPRSLHHFKNKRDVLLAVQQNILLVLEMMEFQHLLASIVFGPTPVCCCGSWEVGSCSYIAGPGEANFHSGRDRELRLMFVKASPSELVRLHITLSSPFLALVHDDLHSKRLNWIPWRLCSSAFDDERFLELRRPRRATILLTRLLQQGPPEDRCTASASQPGPVETLVRRF